MRLYAVNLNQEGRICFGSAGDEDILKNLNGKVSDLKSFKTDSCGKHWGGYPLEVDWFSTKEELSKRMPEYTLEKFNNYIRYETIIIEGEIK